MFLTKGRRLNLRPFYFQKGLTHIDIKVDIHYHFHCRRRFVHEANLLIFFTNIDTHSQ
jgi:hypothetical protein